MQDAAGWDLPFSPEPDLEPSWSWVIWILECLPKIPLLGAGVNMAWYVVEMRRLAEVGMTGKDKDSLSAKRNGKWRDRSVGAVGAVFWMWVWVNPAIVWRISGILTMWCLVYLWNWVF